VAIESLLKVVHTFLHSSEDSSILGSQTKNCWWNSWLFKNFVEWEMEDKWLFPAANSSSWGYAAGLIAIIMGLRPKERSMQIAWLAAVAAFVLEPPGEIWRWYLDEFWVKEIAGFLKFSSLQKIQKHGFFIILPNVPCHVHLFQERIQLGLRKKRRNGK